jgi:hypothetical protein
MGREAREVFTHESSDGGIALGRIPADRRQEILIDVERDLPHDQSLMPPLDGAKQRNGPIDHGVMNDDISMRITLELDDEVLVAANRIAQDRHTSLGRVISDLALQSLTSNAPKVRNTVPLFVPKPANTRPNLDTVNRLRDGE